MSPSNCVAGSMRVTAAINALLDRFSEQYHMLPDAVYLLGAAPTPALATPPPVPWHLQPQRRLTAPTAGDRPARRLLHSLHRWVTQWVHSGRQLRTPHARGQQPKLQAVPVSDAGARPHS